MFEGGALDLTVFYFEMKAWSFHSRLSEAIYLVYVGAKVVPKLMAGLLKSVLSIAWVVSSTFLSFLLAFSFWILSMINSSGSSGFFYFASSISASSFASLSSLIFYLIVYLILRYLPGAMSSPFSSRNLWRSSFEYCSYLFFFLLVVAV